MIVHSNLSKITPDLTINNEMRTNEANTNQRSTNSETIIKNNPEDNKNTTSYSKKCVLESSF